LFAKRVVVDKEEAKTKLAVRVFTESEEKFPTKALYTPTDK
jgi:hypothetical protein